MVLRRLLVLVVSVVATAWVLPRQLAGRDAAPFYEGRAEPRNALARSVALAIRGGVTTSAFHTGNARFDGEWAFGTHQMAALGLAQTMLADPSMRAVLPDDLRRATAGLVAPGARDFGTVAFGEDGLFHLESAKGHAYLGYVALALGLARLADPELPEAALHDRLCASFERKLAAAPNGVIETYPGEAYPVDLASIVGALALHQRVAEVDHRATLERMLGLFRTRFRDPSTGLLVQSVSPSTGDVVDGPRGSGTALGAYFLAFADRGLSLELHRSLVRSLAMHVAGFGAMREYPAGRTGTGDIDSGPVVLGASVSATGFALASSRLHGDRETFVGLCRTAHLFGLPLGDAAGFRYVSGGPLGNAILLAMLTAGPGT